MALSINTSDALESLNYRLFGVDTDGVIKEFRTGIVMTPHANVAMGSGAFGRHFEPTIFNPTSGGTATVYGVDFPAFLVPNNAAHSVMVVSNGIGGSSTGNPATSRPMFGNDTANKNVGTGIHYDSNTGKMCPNNANGAVALTSLLLTSGTINGAKTFGFTRTALNSVKAYIDGTVDSVFAGGIVNNTALGQPYTDSEMGYIGGVNNNGCGVKYTYILVVIGTALSEAEMLRLHQSATGGNRFALVNGADVIAPLSLSGSITVTNIGHASFTADWPAATGGTGPYTYDYSTDGGSTWTNWPANTRNLSGLSPAGGSIAFHVRALDSLSAVTAALTTTVTLAAGADAAPAFTTQPASTNVAVGATATLTWAASGVPTPTLQLQRSTNAGVSWVDIAPTAPGTYTTPAQASGDNGTRYRVRAQSSIASTVSTVYSNEATITVGTPGRFLLTANPADIVRAHGSNSPLASAAYDMWVHHPITGALVVKLSGVTSGAGLFGTITDATLALSTLYRLDFKFSTGEFGTAWRTTEAS